MAASYNLERLFDHLFEVKYFCSIFRSLFFSQQATLLLNKLTLRLNPANLEMDKLSVLTLSRDICYLMGMPYLLIKPKLQPKFYCTSAKLTRNTSGNFGLTFLLWNWQGGFSPIHDSIELFNSGISIMILFEKMSLDEIITDNLADKFISNEIACYKLRQQLLGGRDLAVNISQRKEFLAVIFSPISNSLFLQIIPFDSLVVEFAFRLIFLYKFHLQNLFDHTQAPDVMEGAVGNSTTLGNKLILKTSLERRECGLSELGMAAQLMGILKLALLELNRLCNVSTQE
ncbi:hypothetical protein EGR_05031 [Echinococcus granulosus]|uniref:Uncharacterized protein n=1 Tax=Echinococcus granulosus TaxID=6210 RepID=W6UGS1_ECHGR|nr:hypothetical protein EGR_05031 [Echinococcus granulosus]EUB60178.1 hypothetical protein EGR_05031 [Echinococcus granulosus]